jgi:hypothetical protein
MIRLLGAEKQSAVSLALAYPERRFQFVSDHRVIAGRVHGPTPRVAHQEA